MERNGPLLAGLAPNPRVLNWPPCACLAIADSIQVERIDVQRPAHAPRGFQRVQLRHPGREQRVQRGALLRGEQHLPARAPGAARHRRRHRRRYVHALDTGSNGMYSRRLNR